MRLLSVSLIVIALSISALAAAPAPKKPAPAPKPQPTMKDLALKEAQKFDADHNGKINGSEVLELQSAFRSNPNSPLYLFDDNSNHELDEAEIAKIQFGPAAAKSTPAPAKKSPSNMHPHGAPRKH